MDRRTAVRVLGVGVAGLSGCVGAQSDGSEPTTSETTTRGVEPTTAEDDCPPAAVSESQIHTHSDYGLGFVAAHAKRPRVAVVGEDWRSKLRTGAMSEEDEAFVAQTDFSKSVVFAVQYEMASSAHELRLTDYEFDGATLGVGLCVGNWKAIGPDDAPTTNLLARLDHSGTVPSIVEARIDKGAETVTVSSE